jgi:hypothetical protein
VLAVVAEVDSRAFVSDPGLREIVVTIDAGELAGGYGGST